MTRSRSFSEYFSILPKFKIIFTNGRNINYYQSANINRMKNSVATTKTRDLKVLFDALNETRMQGTIK